ncbi:MAG: hypothetical protein SV375_22320, partial [Thermodesulfobacteriota bacterium]|nr:hypothetical protein [Thermodesulfobacteriota bacterium]
MVPSQKDISMIYSAKRCDSANILEITKIFTNINDSATRLVEKILLDGKKSSQMEKRNLQSLLRMQARLILLRLEPGIRTTNATLYNNQCHRVARIR